MALIIFAIIIGATTDGPLANLWVMLNAFQVIFFIALIDLEIPGEANLAMTVLNIANMENPYTAWVTRNIFSSSFFDPFEYTHRYTAIGFGNRDIMNNMAEIFPILVINIL